MAFHGSRLVSHGSRLVFMVFHGFRWVFMIFQDSKLVFNVFSWFLGKKLKKDLGKN